MTEDSSERLPAPTPNVTLETETFWNAAADERLLIKHCPECESYFYYPRNHCPECFSQETDWVETTGEGTIYSYTITRQIGISEGGYADATPFVLAYVQLDEGPFMLTNIVDPDTESLGIGDDVEVVFQETDGSEDVSLPRFRVIQSDG